MPRRKRKRTGWHADRDLLMKAHRRKRRRLRRQSYWRDKRDRLGRPNHPLSTRHPNSGDLYTPITPEVVQLLHRMRAEHGGTWRMVSQCTYHGEGSDYIKLRVLRRIYQGHYISVSMRVMDRLITDTGVGSLHEFVWFTPEDLIALGLWQDYLPPEEREQVEKLRSGTKSKDVDLHDSGGKSRRDDENELT